MTPHSGRKIRFRRGAWRDLIEAYDWYRDRSQSAAENFLAEVDAALAQVSESPEAWPSYERGTRHFILKRYPYSVIYRAGDDIITIVAVAHHKRRPGYWRRRG